MNASQREALKKKAFFKGEGLLASGIGKDYLFFELAVSKYDRAVDQK